MNTKNTIAKLLFSLSGQENCYTIPKLYVRLTKCHVRALVINQLIFWSGKSTRHKGDWFDKSYSEWKEETFIEERTLRRILKEFEEKKWCETKVELVNGKTILTCRSLMNNILKDIESLLNLDELTPGQTVRTLRTTCPNPPDKLSDSLYTDKTTNKTTDTTTSNNDFFEGYKEKEEASLSKLISDNEIKNRRDKAKDYALKNNRCLEAFEALWSGLDVDLNEAYDDCQSWHDSQGKNIIIGWGTFLHYLKNDLNRRKFAPIKKIAECKSSNTPLSLGSNHIDWNEREIENKLPKEVKEARRNNGMKKCGDLFKLLGQE